MIFTKEFLEKIGKNAKEVDVVAYIMQTKGKSFHDAVLEFAEFCMLEPEYAKKGESKMTRDEKFALLERIKVAILHDE